MENKNEFLTPVGRLIKGSPWEAQTTDADGNPLVFKTGANIGQPRVDYYLGLAVDKNNPEWPAFYDIIQAFAAGAWPHLFRGGVCILPTFAFKITDGDSDVPNQKGKTPRDMVGHAGHWIVNVSGGFQPKVYNTGGTQQITDPNGFKRGSYCRVLGSLKSNKSDQKPGIFLNPAMVEFVYYGEEIFSGPDAETAFGGTPASTYIPPGASATPLAPAAMPAAQPQPQPAPQTTTKYLSHDKKWWTMGDLKNAGFQEASILAMEQKQE